MPLNKETKHTHIYGGLKYQIDFHLLKISYNKGQVYLYIHFCL